MNTVKKRKSALITILIAGFLFYEFVFLYNRYGELLFIETFLPETRLPLQHRNGNGVRENISNQTKPRILCLILTAPQYHQTRAIHVAATWARHCNRAIFITSKMDADLPNSFVFPEAPDYKDLWTKVSKAFVKVYEQDLIESYDWVLKTDDDSFIFMDNLKTALKPFNPNKLIATGHKLLTWEESEVYLNGGSGYVLSRAAVSHLVSKGLKDNECENNLNLGTNEDVNMAFCLTYLGVTLLDFQDSEGNEQFRIYPPQEEIDPRQAYAWSHLWLKKISVNPYKFGFTSLSRQPISFHFVNAETMYLIYYLTHIIDPSIDPTEVKRRTD